MYKENTEYNILCGLVLLSIFVCFCVYFKKKILEIYDNMKLEIAQTKQKFEHKDESDFYQEKIINKNCNANKIILNDELFTDENNLNQLIDCNTVKLAKFQKKYSTNKSQFSELKDQSTLEESMIADKISVFSEEDISDRVELKRLYDNFNQDLI